jgi:hypothetical protein
MCDNANRLLSKRIRRLAIAIVASGVISAPSAYARLSNNIVLVRPADLPELARQTGEAMFLHEANDGRTLLYIERNQGTRLAIFDVTDPSHVNSEGSVHLDAPETFDFVSNLGYQATLVRFRLGHGKAVLDLHNARIPTLKRIQGLPLQGPIMGLSHAGFTVTSQTDAPPTRSYRAVAPAVADAPNLPDLVRVLDVKQIREEITDEDTGTTFLLTEDGLYLIRRPAAEWDTERPEPSGGG